MVIKQSHINLLTVIFIFFMTILMLAGEYSIQQIIKREENVISNQDKFYRYGVKFAKASDYLTNEARKFSVSADLKHLINYWKEINIELNRDKIIQDLIAHKAPEDEILLLKNAKLNSDNLVYTELRSMKLVISSKNIISDNIPLIVTNFKLSPNDQKLTSEQKFNKAREILFDEPYDKDKSVIMGCVTDFQKKVDERTRVEILKSRKTISFARKIRILIIFIIPFCAIIFLLILYKQIVYPVIKYTKAIETSSDNKQIMLTPEGTHELRLLAESFNKKSEDLAISEKHFRLLAENIYDVIWIMDIAGNFIYVSPSIYRQRGFTADEELSHTFTQYLSKKSAKTAQQALDNAVNYLNKGLTPESNKIVLEYMHKNGTMLWCEVTFNALYNFNGDFVGFVGISHDITENKKLQDKMSHLASIVKFSDNSIISMDLYGTIITWNAGAEKMYGYNAGEVVNKSLLIVIPEKLHDEFINLITKVKKGEFLSSYETQRVRKNGSIVDISLTLSPIRDNENNITGISAIAHDISLRKKIEAELSKLNSKFLDHIAHMPMGYIESDKDMIITDWNPFAETIFGYSKQEALGKNIIDLTVPDITKDYVKKRIEDTGAPRSTIGNITKDSRKIICSWYNTPLFDTNKKMYGRAFLVQDITAEKKVEVKIRQAAEEWQNTFDSISDFIFVLDANSTIVRANKAVINFFGGKLSNVLGKKCYNLMHNKDSNWPGCSFEKTEKTNESHVVEVNDSFMGFPLLITTTPILNYKNEIDGVVHIAKDISELKKAEQQMKEMIEMKSSFISMASHELRTPLTSIKESIDVLSEETETLLNSDQIKFLDVAKRNIQRLTNLINDILDFEKLEENRYEFNIQNQDIIELIRDVKNIMTGLAAKKGLELITDESQPQLTAKMDKDKVIQVLSNLINNAIKFTEKGSITISAVDDLKNSQIVVTVEDTGVGISETDLPKLFKEFSQVGPRKTGGTGLGLSISKKIIESLKGKIWAESQIGKGSKFIFTLPK